MIFKECFWKSNYCIRAVSQQDRSSIPGSGENPDTHCLVTHAELQCGPTPHIPLGRKKGIINFNPHTTMLKYKVLVEFTLDDVVYTVDQVVEFTEEVAAPLVAEGKLVAEPQG